MTDWKQYHNPNHYRFARSIEGYHPPKPPDPDRIVGIAALIVSIISIAILFWPGAH